MTGSDEYPADLAVGVTSSRVALISPPARVVHRAILGWFANTGQAPSLAELAQRTSTGDDLAMMLAELHDNDVVRLDNDGQVRAAYPFSAVTTAHRVSIDAGPDVYAMCAVDALGMADMLGRGIAVTSEDPVTGEPIHVTIEGAGAVWTPDTVVVYVGANQPNAEGLAAADRCCTVMNFFASAETAQRWTDAHPTVTGTVLTQGQALRLGVDIFGRLLDE